MKFLSTKWLDHKFTNYNNLQIGAAYKRVDDYKSQSIFSSLGCPLQCLSIKTKQQLTSHPIVKECQHSEKSHILTVIFQEHSFFFCQVNLAFNLFPRKEKQRNKQGSHKQGEYSCSIQRAPPPPLTPLTC